MKILKVLIACEESQTVTKQFRLLGHEAYSCDILDCSGGNPEWHIKDNVLNHINSNWDLMIAHPPCTYLAVSGNRWLYNKDGSKNEERWRNRLISLKFVEDILNSSVRHIALEYPVSVISSQIRKPEQIIQPYMFGDEATKTTCLWLKNLPPLKPTKIVGKGDRIYYKSGKSHPKWYAEALSKSKTKEERQRIRSKTFLGIAKAMADQWSKHILYEETST